MNYSDLWYRHVWHWLTDEHSQDYNLFPMIEIVDESFMADRKLPSFLLLKKDNSELVLVDAILRKVNPNHINYPSFLINQQRCNDFIEIADKFKELFPQISSTSLYLFVFCDIIDKAFIIDALDTSNHQITTRRGHYNRLYYIHQLPCRISLTHRFLTFRNRYYNNDLTLDF